MLWLDSTHLQRSASQTAARCHRCVLPPGQWSRRPERTIWQTDQFSALGGTIHETTWSHVSPFCVSLAADSNNRLTGCLKSHTYFPECVPMATTAPLGWKSAQCPCSWGRDNAVNDISIIHKPSTSCLLTSSVRLHCRLWSTEFQRQTRRSWAHVRNMSLNGWEAKPHSSSVWPWTHHK